MPIDIPKLIDDLQNLDADQLKNVGSLPIQLRAIILACLAAVVAVASYIFFVVPSTVKVNDLVKQEERLKNDYRDQALRAPNLALYQKQIEEMEQTFNVLLTLLPAQVDISEILRDITEVASETEVRIDNFNPSDNQVIKEFYAEQPIKLKLAGTYHNLGNFVSEISKLPRIITLGDFSLVSTDKAGTEKEKVLKIEVTATAYRYVSN